MSNRKDRSEGSEGFLVACGRFIDDHPFMTSLLALAVISGTVKVLSQPSIVTIATECPYCDRSWSDPTGEFERLETMIGFRE